MNFGYTDQCRFHTGWSGAFYLRIFRLNPILNEDTWLARDRDGAEVVFRIEKHLKDTFMNAIKQDMQDNFARIKN